MGHQRLESQLLRGELAAVVPAHAHSDKLKLLPPSSAELYILSEIAVWNLIRFRLLVINFMLASLYTRPFQDVDKGLVKL